MQAHVLAVLRLLVTQPGGRRAVGAAAAAAPLVRLAEGGSAGTARAATAILGHLAQEPDEVSSLVDAGAVGPLALQLRKGAPTEQRAAAGALLALSDGAGGGAAVKAGVLPTLVKLLAAEGAPGQPEAMHLLYRLAAGADTRKAVSAEAGAVAACVSTLQRAHSAAAAEHAAGTLHALAGAEAGKSKRAEILQAVAACNRGGNRM